MCSCTVSCDISGWALIEYIIYCHVLWWIFYYFLLVVTRQSEEWCCRFLTFVHGCLISYSAIRDILVNKSPIDFNSVPLSPAKKNYLSYMLSYFLFDFFWIHLFGNETWVIYAHHASSILIIINVLLKNYGGAGVSYGVAGLELTNPYLQMRWFLRTHGYLNKPIHTITELWFMTLFFLIRMIGGTVLLYFALMRSKTDFAIKLSFLSIYGISVVLQWQIFVYFRKKYLRGGALRGVGFINSRVSISPYFQRRTLDSRSDREDPRESGGEKASVVMTVSSTVTTEVFAAKETESAERTIASTLAESAKDLPSKSKSGTQRSAISVKDLSKSGTVKSVVSAMKEQIPEEPPEESPPQNEEVAQESEEPAEEAPPEAPPENPEEGGDNEDE